MVRWVVLGSSRLALRVAARLDERPGSLYVVTDDEDRAAEIREEGIDVRQADPRDASTLESLSGADVVAALDDRREHTLAAARAVESVHPDAHLVAYAGDGTDADLATLESIADRVIVAGDVVTEFLLSRIGDGGLRVRQLLRVLRSIDDLAVVTHDNPDPDAIASAVALARIAENVGCTADVCYYGEITHEQNRAFVNLLEFDLRNLEPDESLEAYDGFALVDHSRPGVNDQLPEDLPIDVVIDHHPPRMPVEARFVDLRSEVGSTSTLLVDYLDTAGLGFDEAVATGLLYGIRIDTDEFTRQVAAADFEAAAKLVPHADLGLLERVETPSLSGDTLDTLAEAIGNRVEEGSVLLSCVGRLNNRDALAQAADRLLTMEGIQTTLVYGLMDGTIYASARSRGTDVDLGAVLREAFDRIGSAGGHADMAGAQITLGVLEAVEDRDESLIEVVEAVVTDRFLDALEAHAADAITGVYADAGLDPEEFAILTAERERLPDDIDPDQG